jgi:hypothetical protein
LIKDSSWFTAAVGKKVGSGDSTLFWNEVWVGNQTLRQRFQRLFVISLQQNEVISKVGSVVEGQWH